MPNMRTQSADTSSIQGHVHHRPIKNAQIIMSSTQWTWYWVDRHHDYIVTSLLYAVQHK